jgi:serine/threonine protein kinase
MTIEIGRQLGTHEILSALGKGGMGEVWRARDSKLGREVAIKTLPPEFAGDPDRLSRFEREARVLASLNHPNIASIYGLEEFGGTRYLVLELVEGDTLADVVRRGPVPAEEALKLALQIAAAVEAAHEKGVVHRDLKPANIKITPDGKVKVLDFGLAKALQADDQNISNSPTLSMAATAKGIILGTAAYMSPEQARGTNVDSRTDVWAFGCVLYEMLTGRGVFRGDMVSDILASVLARDPDFAQLPAQLHPRLQEILHRCLEKDPKRRWQAIGDVRLELERLLASGVTAPRETVVAPKAKLTTLLPWVAAAVLLTAAATWVLKPATPPEPRPLVRFEYELPENQSFRLAGRNVLAFSPDGRHFVYNSVQGLALRSMDSLTARIIPGTEEALNNPFFSPDGHWVGYYSPGSSPSLKKISIAGGAPVTIGPAANPYGATWGTNGTILFAQGDQGILRVSADGGTPEFVIKIKPGEFAYGPSLLPDGKTVLYSLTRAPGPTRWDQAEIVAQAMNSAEGKVLLRGGSDARYVPTGHLVYAVGTVLFAVAFDVGALEVKGGPVPLVQGVQRAAQAATNTGAANFGLSDHGALVYLNSATTADVSQTTLGIADRNGVVRRLNVPPGIYRSPHVSPDGRRLAVEMLSESGQSSIWIYDLSGTTAIRRLTQEGSNTRPLWTRDSTRIVYGSDREKAHGLYWQLADGSGLPERLTTAQEGLQHYPESFSPDGKILSFGAVRVPSGANSWALWTLSMEGAERKPVPFYDVPEANEFGSAFSPDGKWIAYAGNNANESNPVFGIYVQPYPPTGAKYEISRNGGAWPVWSPIGGELFYRLNVGDANAARIKAVAIATNPVPGFTSDKDLPMQGFIPAVNYKEYDIMPNGKEFIMVFPVTQTPTAAPPRPRIHVVLNWFEELKARVQVK